MRLLLPTLLASLALPAGAAERNLIALSATAGGFGGFAATAHLPLPGGRKVYESNAGNLLLPVGYVAGSYAATFAAREATRSFEVNPHKVVAGHIAGTVLALPVMAALSFSEASFKHPLTWISWTVCVGTVFAGARLGADDFTVRFPAIRF